MGTYLLCKTWYLPFDEDYIVQSAEYIFCANFMYNEMYTWLFLTFNANVLENELSVVMRYAYRMLLYVEKSFQFCKALSWTA